MYGIKGHMSNNQFWLIYDYSNMFSSRTRMSTVRRITDHKSDTVTGHRSDGHMDRLTLNVEKHCL